MGKIGGWPASGFGQNLRAKREAAGLSQRELADKADCNANTIAKLERGEQEPAWPLVLALAKALGVDCTAFNAAQAESQSVEEPEPKKPATKGKPKK